MNHVNENQSTSTKNRGHKAFPISKGMKISHITIGELFMIIAGIALLVSLPFLQSGGMLLWFGAKGSYLAGLGIMIIRKEWKR